MKREDPRELPSAGVALPKDDQLPPFFLHAVAAWIQVGILTLLCAIAGAFTDVDGTHEYFGHLLVGGALVILGLMSAIGDLTERVRTIIEATVGIAVMTVWLTGDIIFHPPFGIFADLDHAGNVHIGIVILVGAAGVFALATVRRTEDLIGIHVFLPLALIPLLLTAHKHSAAVAGIAHSATGLFLLFGAAFRCFGRRMESGFAFILAGYNLFSGQTGLATYGEAVGMTEVAWVCYWTAAGLLVSAFYLLIFVRGELQSGISRISE